jgi:hypothetical protein
LTAIPGSLIGRLRFERVAAQQRPGGVAIAFGWLESLKTPNFLGRAAFGYPDSAEKQGLATTKAV